MERAGQRLSTWIFINYRAMGSRSFSPVDIKVYTSQNTERELSIWWCSRELEFRLRGSRCETPRRVRQAVRRAARDFCGSNSERGHCSWEFLVCLTCDLSHLPFFTEYATSESPGTPRCSPSSCLPCGTVSTRGTISPS